jgi:hypothetical protein
VGDLAGFRPFYRSSFGLLHSMRRNQDGSLSFAATQDCDPVLDRNKAMANHNDGYSPSREMRRVGSIPLVLIMKWKTEEGWDALDPDNKDRLVRKLNDPEYAYLRTAPGRIGYSNGVMR